MTQMPIPVSTAAARTVASSASVGGNAGGTRTVTIDALGVLPLVVLLGGVAERARPSGATGGSVGGPGHGIAAARVPDLLRRSQGRAEQDREPAQEADVLLAARLVRQLVEDGAAHRVEALLEELRAGDDLVAQVLPRDRRPSLENTSKRVVLAGLPHQLPP